MIIVLQSNHSPSQKQRILTILEENGSSAQTARLGDREALIIERIKFSGPKVDFSALEGVDRVIQVKAEYPKIGLSNEIHTKSVSVGNLVVGPGRCLIVAGPCAVESEEQMLRIAHAMKRAGAHILRGGAYKPRTSPYTFQGLGLAGLEILKKAREQTGMPIVTEALDVRDLPMVAEYSDMIQIGSRNMQNFPLLKEAGRLKKPIFLKRGMSATIQEWLLAAEYIAEGGNTDIVLCERGVRSFDPETRNLLDLSCVPILKEKSILPVAVDPSHGTGRRDIVEAMSLASLAAGAHMIMLESHDEPEKALSDGFQALKPEQLAQVIRKIRTVAEALNIQVP